MSPRILPFLLLFSALSACLHRPDSITPGVKGPPQANIDLYRDRPGGDKLFVTARLPDGKEYVFLLDTGASISVISSDVAHALSLPVEVQRGHLVGIGGRTPWNAAVLEYIRIGPYRVRNIEVAVGVPGVPERAGLVPLAGILGNNVWGRFQLVVDYPANRLVLANPGVLPIPPRAEPMFFNGQHPLTRTVLSFEHGDTVLEQPVVLEIDTGARGLILIGPSNDGLEDMATDGIEPILGIGAGDHLPPSALLRPTQRVLVPRIEVGGTVIERPIQATWLDGAPDNPRPTAIGMPGLLGYDVMRGHRVVIDYPARRFALLPSAETDSAEATARADLHRWYLRHIRKGRTNPIEEVRLLLWVGKAEEAHTRLDRAIHRAPARADIRVLRARIRRSEGDVEGALADLAVLTIRDLVEQGEIVAWVNSHWLQGNTADAVKAARSATALVPEISDTWVALTDAMVANGQYREAREAIERATRLDQNPDSHLLRRAFTALLDQDLYGGMTHLRRLIDLHPSSGYPQWLYAASLAGDQERALIQADLGRARSRLHPGDGPLDFMSGAWELLGDHQTASTLLAVGLIRDCGSAKSSASEANCDAWYHALARRNLDRARARVQTALIAHPDRPEFLDTLAMVLEAMGDRAGAWEPARRAAVQRPDDVYLVIQAMRLRPSKEAEPPRTDGQSG